MRASVHYNDSYRSWSWPPHFASIESHPHRFAHLMLFGAHQLLAIVQPQNLAVQRSGATTNTLSLATAGTTLPGDKRRTGEPLFHFHCKEPSQTVEAIEMSIPNAKQHKIGCQYRAWLDKGRHIGVAPFHPSGGCLHTDKPFEPKPINRSSPATTPSASTGVWLGNSHLRAPVCTSKANKPR